MTKRTKPNQGNDKKSRTKQPNDLTNQYPFVRLHLYLTTFRNMFIVKNTFGFFAHGFLFTFANVFR